MEAAKVVLVLFPDAGFRGVVAVGVELADADRGHAEQGVAVVIPDARVVPTGEDASQSCVELLFVVDCLGQVLDITAYEFELACVVVFGRGQLDAVLGIVGGVVAVVVGLGVVVGGAEGLAVIVFDP